MLLETSFIVDLLGGARGAVALAQRLDRAGETVRIPSPVLFELWVGTGSAGDVGPEAQRIDELLLSYDSVPFDAGSARLAGQLQAALGGEGKRLGTVDAQIAGIALFRDEELVTRDDRLVMLGHGLRTVTYRPSRA
jgi:tRNA(fMet)-specific endonuclease VapC